MILLSGLMSCEPTESWSRRIYYILYISSGAALQRFVLVETEVKYFRYMAWTIEQDYRSLKASWHNHDFMSSFYKSPTNTLGARGDAVNGCP